MPDELINYIGSYTNSEAHNDYLFEHFKHKTDTIKFLKDHRDYIEAENLGFGERAFTYMWYLMIKHIEISGMNPVFLEIGVFKGQIVSLWSLIAKQLNITAKVYGITPLTGNPVQKYPLIRRILARVSKRYRDNMVSGNHYEDSDYFNIIRNLFSHFDLDFNLVKLIKGYSTDATIIERVSTQRFAIIYVDGDHTFEGVLHDIKQYACLVEKGGFLVMDDASCNIPGTKFWKGHKSVSDACKIIDKMQFKNILNIGHNRVYQKL
ncbi:CmcI family methyltransferase [Mucilaginibacter flavidus]|uniref:CmcI family methyltransferase n=1 Tax=Mucilaginibacter flavidus TaxID=2949309 RepID=UPI002092817C|nr:CmcI family methyltransferase [Mucilaginibacter flavidus]MCO5947681.1 class I SAM-dependent methyltransferase [Mucilaginibacter flavidus]